MAIGGNGRFCARGHFVYRLPRVPAIREVLDTLVPHATLYRGNPRSVFYFLLRGGLIISNVDSPQVAGQYASVPGQCALYS